MKRPAHIPWPKDENGNPLDTPDKRARYLERMNVRLAEEFEAGEKDVTGTPEELENLRWQTALWRDAHRYEAAYHRDVKMKGALKTNRDKIDAANDLTYEIAQYYKAGMSAQQVRSAMLRNNERNIPSLRTIQRHLKKIAPSRN